MLKNGRDVEVGWNGFSFCDPLNRYRAALTGESITAEGLNATIKAFAQGVKAMSLSVEIVVRLGTAMIAIRGTVDSALICMSVSQSVPSAMIQERPPPNVCSARWVTVVARATVVAARVSVVAPISTAKRKFVRTAHSPLVNGAVVVRPAPPNSRRKACNKGSVARAVRESSMSQL